VTKINTGSTVSSSKAVEARKARLILFHKIVEVGRDLEKSSGPAPWFLHASPVGLLPDPLGSSWYLPFSCTECPSKLNVALSIQAYSYKPYATVPLRTRFLLPG